jgi:hypothetical protein
MTLSTAILNLPAQSHKNYSVSFNGGYKFGHRDARHAASSLAGQREAQLLSALDAILETVHQPNPTNLAEWRVSPGNGMAFARAIEAAREAVKG